MTTYNQPNRDNLFCVILVGIILLWIFFALTSCSRDTTPTKYHNAKKVNKYNQEQLNRQFGY